MKNYKLLIAYNGERYAGWQIQRRDPTVQGTVVDAIGVVIKERVALNAAGRTDSGVHAIGQVANFATDKEFDLGRFRHSMNGILPEDISVRSIEEIPLDFHARYSATSRKYLYLISQGKSPFYAPFSWRIDRPLDIDTLNKMAKVLVGKQDFKSFAKQSDEISSTICEVKFARWLKRGDKVYFMIEADRFVHGMVRAVVGTLVKISGSSDAELELQDIIQSEARIAAGMSAPAQGLFLYKVKYPSDLTL